MTKWEEIETAPTGVKLLVWGEYDFDRDPQVGVFTAWVEDGNWRSVYLDPSPHDDEYPTVRLVRVTHWMLLPEPPK